MLVGHLIEISVRQLESKDLPQGKKIVFVCTLGFLVALFIPPNSLLVVPMGPTGFWSGYAVKG